MIIDGEIMETLWSGMNKVSVAARSMTKAHRQETLDDYMRDSNWKKTVGIGGCLFYGRMSISNKVNVQFPLSSINSNKVKLV